MMSGLAADELFLGYYYQYIYFLKEKYLKKDNYKKHLKEWNENTGYYINNPLIKNIDNFLHNKNNLSHLFSDIENFKPILKEKRFRKLTKNSSSPKMIFEIG